ncbi:MAG: transposase [Clostridiales bacterium]|nr:transposase [Clostridiales bacterium]
MCYNSSLKEAKQVRKPYPTDLTDTQWKEIAPHYSGMRNRKWSKHELTNAVLHIVKTGCQWRQLPHDFPPYQTVYSFFSRGAWEKLPWRWIVERTFGWLNAASSLIKVLYIANLQYFLTTKEIP